LNDKNIIVVGDRVLVKPKTLTGKTKSGLYLPPGVQEKEKVLSGYAIKVGPGYPIPVAADSADEAWKSKEAKARYVPLQAKEGDLVVFLRNGSYEIDYNDELYYIVSQNSILLLERDESLFE
jgi:chaperonin GroES